MKPGAPLRPPARAARPPGENFRDCICRLVRADHSPIGTAFGIGPRVALTCHHCVAGADPGGLRLLVYGHAEPMVVGINEVVLPPQPEAADLALLRLAEDLPAWLAISSECPPRYANLVGYGFPGERPQQAAVQVHFDSRGIQPAGYSGKSLRYELRDALVLAGDAASGGMSGGPVLDTVAGVAVAMIVGGPEYNGRAIAMTFHGADPGGDWPPYQFAVQWNGRNSVHKGWAMNVQAAQQVCSRQTQDAIRRQHTFDLERYVPRQQALAAHAAFLAGQQAAMLVQGLPNIGKSTLMAALAMQGAQRSLYFDAFALPGPRVPLLDTIRGALPPEAQAEQDGVQRLAQVLAADGLPLVVYVDAINEMEGELRHVGSWLEDAIQDCAALCIKLVLSCRSDAWSGFSLTASLPTLTLGEFSSEEAAAARARYGLAEPPAHELARHPLFFRMAASMAGKEQPLDEGWYGVIHAFVRHLIQSAPAMRASRAAATFSAVERIASSLGNDSENIPREFAANQLGGSAELDALISAGLFKTRDGQAVRFAFDELAEALRPPLACADSELIAMWQQAFRDEGSRRRLTGSVLRAFSLHDEAGLARHFDTLQLAVGALVQLDAEHLVQLGAMLAAIDGGLPDSARQWSARLFDIYLSYARELATRFKGIPHFIEGKLAQAPLRAPYKIALLAAMLPYCSDSKLRMKDLEDRGTLGDLLDAAAEQSTIAGALLRLAQDHTVEARPHLLPLLAEARPLRMGEGEVTVGQIVSFILRITAQRELGDLVARLLEDPSDKERRRLLNEVSRRYPADSLLCALDYLDGASAIAAMDSIVASSLQTMGPGCAPGAVIARLQRIIDEGTPASRVRAASLIRIAVPDDLAAWDILHEAAIGGAGISLRPVPRARTDAFLGALARRDSAAAINDIYQEDEPALQASLASIAEQVLARHGKLHARELGLLAEHKLYNLARHEAYRPWLAFALKLIRAGFAEAMSPLIYFAYPQASSDQDSRALWDAVMQAGNTDIIKTWVGFSMMRAGEAPADLTAGHLVSAATADLPATLECLADAAWQAKAMFERYDNQPGPALPDILASFMQEVQQRPALASQLPPALAAWQAGQPLVGLFAGLVNVPTS